MTANPTRAARGTASEHAPSPAGKRLAGSGVLVSAFALAGCGWTQLSRAGKAAASQAVARRRSTGADDARVTADTLPPRWWHMYDDPVLDKLEEDALAANTELRIAGAKPCPCAGVYPRDRRSGRARIFGRRAGPACAPVRRILPEAQFGPGRQYRRSQRRGELPARPVPGGSSVRSKPQRADEQASAREP
jgi:hypothetical protein